MEQAALHWFAMRCCLVFLRECPDDPAAIRFREAMRELRRCAD